MNENDSKEAHDQRDACVRELAYSHRVGLIGSPFASTHAIVSEIIRMAWEDGYDYASGYGPTTKPLDAVECSRCGHPTIEVMGGPLPLNKDTCSSFNHYCRFCHRWEVAGE